MDNTGTEEKKRRSGEFGVAMGEPSAGVRTSPKETP